MSTLHFLITVVLTVVGITVCYLSIFAVVVLIDHLKRRAWWKELDARYPERKPESGGH